MPDVIRILGVDPGLSRCGYAVIDYDGSTPVSIESGFITTDKDLATPRRLSEIIEQLTAIIDEYRPHEFAIERVYFHRNVSTAIDVAMVMGAAIVLAMDKKMECSQYAPKQIKRAIVGTGNADKAQVQKMVERLYNLDSPPKPADVADALAVALTHAHMRNSVEDASVG